MKPPIARTRRLLTLRVGCLCSAWLLLTPACGGDVQDGGADGRGGSASSTGGSVSSTGGSVSSTGGSVSSTGGSVSSTGDCSLAGCAMAPICGQSCTAPCGCCPCLEGATTTLEGTAFVCNNGCWGAAGGDCSYGKDVYAVGDSFPSSDGCNTCTCMAQAVVGCTSLGCFCDPAAETPPREYVLTSVSACATAKFACPEHTTYFANDCGCGCEQSADCPDYINCVPLASTDCTDQKLLKCPYSPAVY